MFVPLIRKIWAFWISTCRIILRKSVIPTALNPIWTSKMKYSVKYSMRCAGEFWLFSSSVIAPNRRI